MDLLDRPAAANYLATEKKSASREQDALQLIDEGNAIEDSGRLEAALERYDAAICVAPNLARAHLNRGNALLALGNVEEAADSYATALTHDPGLAAAHYGLGNAYQKLTRHDEALKAYRRAIELKPDFADAEVALGALHHDLGQCEQAAASYRRALRINPKYAAVHSNLGAVLLDVGAVQQAIASYRQALELDATLDIANFGLANALQTAGLHAEAADCYRKVLQNNPVFGLAHGNLGNALAALGLHEEAVASFRRALEFSPQQDVLHIALGNALRKLGKTHESLTAFRRATELAPKSPTAHFSLGNGLQDLAQIQAAIESYRRALELEPNHVEAMCMLGNLLAEMGELQESLVCHRRMLELDPGNIHAHANIGNTFTRLGEVRNGIASYRRALEINPDFAEARSSLLFALNYLADCPPAVLLSEARLFGDQAARRARPYTNWSNSPVPDRVLRIGLVSGDLRTHSVGYFVQGVLAALASSSSKRLELYAYANQTFFDGVSDQIRTACEGWCVSAGFSDEALAQRIRHDQIDILIDLSGHTANNRLLMFAWKPAPIQVTWLGYFATTGVEGIDYLIADPWTLPETTEACFTEKIRRMPETRLCFTAPAEEIGVALSPPAHANGYITFGCFNNVTKVNDAVIAAWSRILAAVPGSRLFLKSKAIQESSVRQTIIERFGLHGIEKTRLLLEGESPRSDYLAAYDRVDIGLDPFPYPGGATTVEALWMGVPVLTLAGTTFLSRQGVGLLMNARLADWVATDVDDYVARAISHASDLPRLIELRGGLRQRVIESPIFDTKRFVENFETLLRGMWREWCAKHPFGSPNGITQNTGGSVRTRITNRAP